MMHRIRCDASPVHVRRCCGCCVRRRSVDLALDPECAVMLLALQAAAG